jgi:hypothetical protein
LWLRLIGVEFRLGLAEVEVEGGRPRVLRAGSPPPNPSVIPGSKKMRMLLAKLRERVDMVIIDTREPGCTAKGEPADRERPRSVLGTVASESGPAVSTAMATGTSSR